jgi:hypothetical protein
MKITNLTLEKSNKINDLIEWMIFTECLLLNIKRRTLKSNGKKLSESTLNTLDRNKVLYFKDLFIFDYSNLDEDVIYLEVIDSIFNLSEQSYSLFIDFILEKFIIASMELNITNLNDLKYFYNRVNQVDKKYKSIKDLVLKEIIKFALESIPHVFSNKGVLCMLNDIMNVFQINADIRDIDYVRDNINKNNITGFMLKAIRNFLFETLLHNFYYSNDNIRRLYYKDDKDDIFEILDIVYTFAKSEDILHEYVNFIHHFISNCDNMNTILKVHSFLDRVDESVKKTHDTAVNFNISKKDRLALKLHGIDLGWEWG